MAAWEDSYHVVGLAASQFRQLCQVNICFIQLHSGSFMQTAVPLLIHEVNLISFGFGISPSPFLALGVAAATAAQPAEVAVSDIPTTCDVSGHVCPWSMLTDFMWPTALGSTVFFAQYWGINSSDPFEKALVDQYLMLYVSNYGNSVFSFITFMSNKAWPNKPNPEWSKPRYR